MRSKKSKKAGKPSDAQLEKEERTWMNRKKSEKHLKDLIGGQITKAEIYEFCDYYHFPRPSDKEIIKAME